MSAVDLKKVIIQLILFKYVLSIILKSNLKYLKNAKLVTKHSHYKILVN